MKFTKVDGVDKEVSRIVFGTMTPPIAYNYTDDRLMDAVIDSGINTLDLARVYAGAEENIGKYMKRKKNRNDLVLLSKCCHPDGEGNDRVSREAMRGDFETSASLLGVDYIDIYVLHRDDPKVPAGDICEWLNELYREGKIGAFGGSNWSGERIREVNAYAAAHGLRPFTISSPNFCLGNQLDDPWIGTCVSIAGEQNKAERLWYEETQMPIVSYSSLAHGLMSGRIKSTDESRMAEVLDEFTLKGFGYAENFERLRRVEQMAKEKNATVAQIALAWLMCSKVNVCAAVSTTRPERIYENNGCLDIQLTDAECDYLDLRD